MCKRNATIIYNGPMAISRYKDLIDTLKPESCVVGKCVRVHACE